MVPLLADGKSGFLCTWALFKTMLLSADGRRSVSIADGGSVVPEAGFVATSTCTSTAGPELLRATALGWPGITFLSSFVAYKFLGKSFLDSFASW
jgi:hypothetical protein